MSRRRAIVFRRRLMKYGIGALVFAVLTLFVVASFTRWAQHTAMQARSTDFVPVKGLVIASSHGSYDHGQSPKKVVLEVLYRFGSYEFTRKEWGYPYTRSERHGRSVIDRFPAGSQVEVHVDPNAPENAVLDRGLRPVDLQRAFFIAALTIPVALVWLAYGANLRHLFKRGGGRNRQRSVSPASPRLEATAAALVYAMTALFIGSLFAALITGRLADWHGPLTGMWVAWSIVLGVALLVFVITLVKAVKRHGYSDGMPGEHHGTQT